MLERFIVSRDDSVYEAFPDVALTPSGRLVCVFLECTHHGDRSWTRCAAISSDDRGRTWSAKRVLAPEFSGDPEKDFFWDCPRITQLADGRLVALTNRICRGGTGAGKRETVTEMLTSTDDGDTWSEPVETPLVGIVPDRIVELKVGDHAGRLMTGAHEVEGEGDDALWHVMYRRSDDGGATWSRPATAAGAPGLKLCEGSLVELPGGELVVFMRENSHRGKGAFKSVSRDGGETWSEAVEFPLPGCHRPVAGMLQSGKIMITHRFCHGGQGWIGWWTQNFFAATTDVESCLAGDYMEAHARIMPLDFDRHHESDCGYSGWVQFEDGEIYVVSYIMDDSPKGQIRGYSFREPDMLIEPQAG